MSEYAKLIKYSVLVLLTGSLLYWVGHSSYRAGQRDIQEQWDTEVATYKKAVDTLKDRYATLESNVRIENQRNSDELAEKEKSHALTLARLNVEYAGRMQLSEQRANRYQRQAKGGTVEQADLASHAAKLDRAVEEGRQLVAQLTTTLRQRDDQLRAVSQQLINDRNLLTLDDTK